MFSVNIKVKDLGKCFFQVLRSLSDISFSEKCDLPTKLKIEAKWWDKSSDSHFKENEGNKFYILSMFPYPSGNLHMGHVRVYTISDALARYYRMKGKNVLHPIGFDAFGLPAENAAIINKLDPSEWTYKNISTMKTQLKQLGFTFDWDREVITCSENYYKFTQYLFLLLQKAGLVYRKESSVNWDPVDKTVLAEEQIDSLGRSWRSGAVVEKKIMKQWFFRTTRFALALKDGLNSPELRDWKDIIDLQKHWIGECNGANIDFDLFKENKKCETLTLWLRYPEHISKAEFIAASTSSIFALKNKCTGKLNYEAINPFNNKKLPVFISDELEFDEGCDMKLGIPSLSESDKSFALKYDLKINDELLCEDFEKRLQICRLAIDAERGGYFVSSKLRDWLISRQRHWGTPIPIIHCKKCGTLPAREEDLPILVSRSSKTTCYKCKNPAELETDTMDTFVDSSWYFLRYTDPSNNLKPFSVPNANELMPVDIYIGGKEHAVLHLYYSRFISYFLHSINLLKGPEPFHRLLVQGMILGKTYYLKDSGKCLREGEVEKCDNGIIEKSSGLEVIEVWEKMSKSKFNGIEPESVIKEYGVDTTRLLILSQAAPTSPRQWDASSFAGVLHWQQRIWSLLADFIDARENEVGDYDLEQENDLWDARNFYIKGTSFNFEEAHQFNVAISKLQGLTNSLKKCKKAVMAKSPQFEMCLASLIIMLYPLAPHFSCQLWEGIQSASNRIDVGSYVNWELPVFKQKWPQLDDDYQLELHCKVNNAIKGTIKVPVHKLYKYTDQEALNIALAQKKVSSFLKGRDILGYSYSFVENREASVNIVVDHTLKKKTVDSQA